MNQTYNDMWLCHNDNLDIEVRDDDMPLITKYIIKKEDLDPDRYMMTYGKYKGRSLFNIHKYHPDYIEWLQDNNDDMLMKQCIMNL